VKRHGVDKALGLAFSISRRMAARANLLLAQDASGFAK
jgi:hypothetical protein